MEKLFEQACREKMRFSSSKGQLSIEDLWDLKLEDLDRLAKVLNKGLKESEEESFIKTRTKANKSMEMAFEIVKHIIKVKLDEAEEKKVRAERTAKRAQIAELIEKKQMQSLEGKSIEELMKELEAL